MDRGLSSTAAAPNAMPCFRVAAFKAPDRAMIGALGLRVRKAVNGQTVHLRHVDVGDHQVKRLLSVRGHALVAGALDVTA